MPTKKSKPTKKLKKAKPSFFLANCALRPNEPFSNGVLGDDELIGMDDMSLDVEATATRVVSLGYKQILDKRDKQRLLARLSHNAWMKEHGYAR